MLQAVYYHTPGKVVIQVRSQSQDGIEPVNGSSGRTHNAGENFEDVVKYVATEHIPAWFAMGYQTFTFQFLPSTDKS